MQVSYRYRHLPGLYRTCRIPFANTSLVPFQYLHANTYNLQANVFWPGTFWIPAHQYIHTLPVNIFWPDTVLLSAYTYFLPANIFWPGTILPSTYRYQHCTVKYLLAQYHFALSIPVPASYWQISSGPVPFCYQRTGTSIVPANIFWPSTILPLAYRYRHLTGKYLLAQYHFALSVPVPTSYEKLSIGPVQICFQHTGNNILHARLGIGWARQQKFVTQEYLMTSLAKRVISLTKLNNITQRVMNANFMKGSWMVQWRVDKILVMI